jgi:cytochrome c-type biogenesis protein CcmF
MVILFVGLAGDSFKVNIRQTLQPGETATIPSPLGHEYQLTYEGMSTTMASASNANRNLAFQLAALFRVAKDGEPLKNMTTEKRGYIQQDNPTTEVGIRSSFLEDLYVILSDVPDIQGAVNNRADAQTATFTFLINPLVGWIWFGGMIVAVGGLIGLWPSAGPLGPRSATGASVQRAGRLAAGAAGD